MRITRNRIASLATLALAGATLVLPPAPASAQTAQSGRFSGVTLRVGTYGGSWKDAVHEHVGKHLEAMGAKVEYVIGNAAENLSKIVAARGRAVPIDVLEVGPAERIAMIKNDFLAEIPIATLPNVAKIPAKVVDKWAVPHQMVQNGIVYRMDKFADEKIPTPKTFGDLDNPKLANRVAFPDVNNPQHWPAVAGIAYETGASEAAPEKAFAKIVHMKPLYFYAAASELAQRFSSGDAIAAPWHVGWAVRLDRGGMKVGFIHPQVGKKRGALEYNYLAITKGTKNAEAAAAFINLSMDTAEQVNFARAVGVVPTNRDARAQLAKDPVLGKFMLLTDSEIDNAFSVNWDKVDQEKWRASWTRAISK